MKRWLFAITLLCSSGYAWAEDEEKVIQRKLTLSSLEEVGEKFRSAHEIQEGLYATDISMNNIYDDFFNSLSTEKYKKTNFEVEFKPAIEGTCTNTALTKTQKVSLTYMKVLEAVPINDYETYTYLSFELAQSNLRNCDLLFLDGKYDKALFSFPMKQSGNLFEKEGESRIRIGDDVDIRDKKIIQDYLKKIETKTVFKEITIGDEKIQIIRHSRPEEKVYKDFDIPYTIHLNDKEVLEFKASYSIYENHLREFKWSQIENILDINGDGILDFITSENHVEASGDTYFHISQKDGTYKKIKIPRMSNC